MEAVSDGHIKTSNTNGEKDEVFGSFLNKKPKKETVLKDKSQQEPEKHATWKLRRWTKGGYKTVVMNSDEEKCGENETPNGEESELDSTLVMVVCMYMLICIHKYMYTRTGKHNIHIHSMAGKTLARGGSCMN